MERTIQYRKTGWQHVFIDGLKVGRVKLDTARTPISWIAERRLGSNKFEFVGATALRRTAITLLNN